MECMLCADDGMLCIRVSTEHPALESSGSPLHADFPGRMESTLALEVSLSIADNLLQIFYLDTSESLGCYH